MEQLIQLPPAGRRCVREFRARRLIARVGQRHKLKLADKLSRQNDIMLPRETST